MNNTDPESIALYGEPRPPREPIVAQAGPLRFIVEDGMIKHVRHGHVELVRRVYFAVRDSEWDTIYPTFSNIKTNATDRTFQITFDAECKADHVHYRWQGFIEGNAQGVMTFRAQGEPVADFQSNRVGLCLLLPAETLAGVPYTLTHQTSEETSSQFPKRIDHALVGAQFQSIRYTVGDGSKVTCAIEGAAFDMEDQRLYMETTYKAYAPLPHAYPDAKAGEKFTQTFTLQAKIAESTSQAETPVVIRIGDQPANILPRLGLTLNATRGELAPTEAELRTLAAAKLAHVRLEIDLDNEAQARDTLAQATPIVARITDTILLAVRHLTAERIDILRAMLEPLSSTKINRLLLEACDCSLELLPALQSLKRIAGLTLEIGGPGSADVSGHPHARDWARAKSDFVCWAGSPAIHQEDDETMMENTYGIGIQLNDIRQERTDAVLGMGPFRLDGPWPRPQPSPRYAGQFAASWLASAVRHLSLGGARFATWFNITGPEGVFPRPSAPQNPYPTLEILAWLTQRTGWRVCDAPSSDTLHVEAFTLQRDDHKTCTLIVNKTFASQEIEIDGLPGVADVLAFTGLAGAPISPFPGPPMTTCSQSDSDRRLTLAPYQIVLLSPQP